MTAARAPQLGYGIGWRRPIDLTVERLPGVDFVEAIAENVDPRRLFPSLRALRERGTPVVPHGVSLSLGGADRPDPARLAHLASCAQALGSPLVSEHIAFTRAGQWDAGHLIPLPRTWDTVTVVAENVRIAQDQLPVPLALENIAPLLAWPGEELTEGQFLAEIAARTGALLLVDVANLHTAHVNLGIDPHDVLRELPLERLGYVHVAGGVARDGIWHDTHTHPVPPPVLDLLTTLATRAHLPGVLLERDGAYPRDAELAAELAAIRAAAARGQARREARDAAAHGHGPAGADGAAAQGPAGRGPGAHGAAGAYKAGGRAAARGQSLREARDAAAEGPGGAGGAVAQGPDGGDDGAPGGRGSGARGAAGACKVGGQGAADAGTGAGGSAVHVPAGDEAGAGPGADAPGAQGPDGTGAGACAGADGAGGSRG